MFSPYSLLALSLLYVLFLFAIAIRGDRKRAKPLHPLVYALAIGVYCTSWTFYGAVGTAATQGWGFLPIYLGPALTFLLAWNLFKKIGVLTDTHGISSIADFIATRYGKAQPVAVIITVAAVLAVVPYISLQLKAISNAWYTLAPQSRDGTDPALLATVLLIIFAVAFGTARLNRREHHRGMMLSLAVESAIKLVAFAAVSIGASTALFGDFGNLMSRAAANPSVQPLFQTNFSTPIFLTQTVLGALAILCLPRQFQISFVEAGGAKRTDMARWVMPIYLGAFAIFVVPIAAAGLMTFGASVSPDSYVLLLPLAADMPSLAFLAYIGGLSAGVGMIIAATLALSTMVCNELVVPAYVRYARIADEDLSELILASRRWAIAGIMLMAWLYYENAPSGSSLASIGLLAFIGAAQFGPALIAGLYWRGANRYGAFGGILTGICVWLYTLAVPSFLGLSAEDAIAWNDAVGFSGLVHLDPVTHSTLWSLSINGLVFVLVSLLTRPNFTDRMQASIVVDAAAVTSTPKAWRGVLSVGDLEVLLARYLGVEAARTAWVELYEEMQLASLRPQDEASQDVMSAVERRLAGALGASSARLVLDSRIRGRTIKAEELVSVVDESNRALQSSREQLHAALENLAPGVSVIDANQRLVAWNRRYQEIFDYPDALLQVGQPIEELLRHNARRNFFGDGDQEAQVQRRLAHLNHARSHRRISYLPTGTVIELSGNPMPDGGFVTSFYDITELKRNESALKQSEANIRLYTDNVPIMLAYLDNDRRILFVNQAFEEIMGFRRDAILGKHAWEVFSEDEYALRQPHMGRALKGERQSFEVSIDFMDMERFYEAVYVPHQVDGRVLGLFIMYQDITERRMAESMLKTANETLEERVSSRTQELSNLNLQLMQENRIRAKTESDLTAAKAEAELANLSKTRFLAAASHDLMQPLNAARLFAAALERQVSGDAVHMAKNLDSSLDNAEELLGTLLEISKLDAGATKFNPQPLNVRPLVEQLGAEFHALSEEKGLTLRARPRDAWVSTEPLMLRRVLQNFLSNALRYTRQGKVLLGTRVRGDHVELQVWDTGIGIAEQDQARVFEEFARLESGRAQHQKGMGLGLSISIRLAKLMGGEVTLRSTENKGTCFSLRLPLTDKRAQPTNSPILTNRRTSTKLQGLKVLCLDNEPMILEGMGQLLCDWGCSVWTVESGYDALRAIEDLGRPDLLILDYHLDNNATGLEALEAIKRVLDDCPPAILLTADRTEETRTAALEAGARVMNKPVKPAGLRALMSSLAPTGKA